MKKIVICDDVEIDRSILRHFLEKYFEDREEEALVEEYSSGKALTADVEEGYLEMDLLFLDIFMNGMNGDGGKAPGVILYGFHCLSDHFA